MKCAARLVTGARIFDSITPHLKSLHWLPIKQRIEYKIALIMFCCLNNCAPSYLTNMFSFYHPARSSSHSAPVLRAESSGRLVVPRSRTKTYGDRASPSAALESGMRYLKTFVHPIPYPNSNPALKPITFAWRMNKSIFCINVEFAPLIKLLEEAHYK